MTPLVLVSKGWFDASIFDSLRHRIMEKRHQSIQCPAVVQLFEVLDNQLEQHVQRIPTEPQLFVQMVNEIEAGKGELFEKYSEKLSTAAAKYTDVGDSDIFTAELMRRVVAARFRRELSKYLNAPQLRIDDLPVLRWEKRHLDSVASELQADAFLRKHYGLVSDHINWRALKRLDQQLYFALKKQVGRRTVNLSDFPLLSNKKSEEVALDFGALEAAAGSS